MGKYDSPKNAVIAAIMPLYGGMDNGYENTN